MSTWNADMVTFVIGFYVWNYFYYTNNSEYRDKTVVYVLNDV